MVGSLLPVTLNNAHASRGGHRILGPIDLTLSPGGATIVMGPNGAGKTSLLRMIHGLMRISEGEITWGVSLEEARQRQAFVFQTPVILRRSVTDNIAYPLRLLGAPKDEARALAAEWAERVGLGHALEQSAVALSGGEKQKLALARALIRKPELLFLDEPTANLDGKSTRDIESILRAAIDRGTKIVMATHNLGQAQRLSEEVIFLHHGRVLERGEAAVFFGHPHTPEAAAFIKGDIVE